MTTDMECPICYIDYTSYQTCKTPCGHIFHERCIDKWFDINPSCPVCRCSPCDDSKDSFITNTKPLVRADVVFGGGVTVNVMLSNHLMEKPRWNEMLVENAYGDFEPYEFRTWRKFFLRKVIGGNQDPSVAPWHTHSTRKFIDAAFPADRSQRWIHMMDGECSIVYRTDSGRYVADASFVIGGDDGRIDIQFIIVT